MKWQCALLKRWLPEYPDGDLPAWGQRWLKSHVPGCPACRQELAELRQVIAAIEATPVGDPAPEFWGEFSRDLHLKLVQAAQEGQAVPASTSSRWFRLPYLLGAPAVAALLLYVAVQLTGPGAPIQNQAVVMHLPGSPPAQDQALVKRESAAKMAAVPQKVPATPALPMAQMEQFVTVAIEEGAPLPVEEVDISGWDLDAELAGMTDQEKNVFLNQLHQRKKDGSCVEEFSFCSWG
jgi:anti-sigma factor RsiW